MGCLRTSAAITILLAGWTCAYGQATPVQVRETPDSVYDVKASYGWTMSSRESSGYYTFYSPLRLDVRIFFTDVGDGRLQMHLRFSEVSYTDQNHSWTIRDFSDPQQIRKQFAGHFEKVSGLEHLTELAAFEEEALGYLLALSHGLTVAIDPVEDSTITFAELYGRYSTVLTGAEPATATSAAPDLTALVRDMEAKAGPAIEACKQRLLTYEQLKGRYERVRRSYAALKTKQGEAADEQRNLAALECERAAAELKRAAEEYAQATRDYDQAARQYDSALWSRIRAAGQRSAPAGRDPSMVPLHIRLGMLWTQQIRQLAMFTQRPYDAPLPSTKSLASHPWEMYRCLERWCEPGSGAEPDARAVAFSLGGLYRWEPMPKDFFTWMDASRQRQLKTGRDTRLSRLRRGQYLVGLGAWFVAAGNTDHKVDETLEKTTWGSVKYRRVNVVSRLNGVNAMAILPRAKGVRGTIWVDAETTLEAKFVYPLAAELDDRVAAAMRKNDYEQAIALYAEHLRTCPVTPQTERIWRQLDKLRAVYAAVKAEEARKRAEEKARIAAEDARRQAEDARKCAEQETRRRAEEGLELAEDARECFRRCTLLADNGLRNNRPDLARAWLTKVIRDYPETTWAQKARQRISEIQPVTAEDGPVLRSELGYAVRVTGTR